MKHKEQLNSINILSVLLLLTLFSTSLFAGTLINRVDSTIAPIQYTDTIINSITYIDSRILEYAGNVDSKKWYPYKEKLVLKSSNTTFQFTNNSIFALFKDDSLLVTDHAPLYINDIFWIPISTISMFNPLMKNQLQFVNDSVIEYQTSSGLLALTVQERSNGTLIELEFSKAYSFDKWFHAPHYILRFNDLDIEPDKWKKTFKRGLVKKIIPVKEKSLSQLTFEVRPNIDEVELLSKKGSRKIQLLFRKKLSVTKSKKTVTKRNTIKNIIIDAGHGGRDPGAHGLRYNEKDITLKVAKSLKKILKKNGFNPLLTRETDEYLTLKDRPKFATDNEGDMFISLHCNAIGGTVRKKNRVKGFKMYILREAKSKEDKAIARRENAAISEVTSKSKKEITPVEWILLEHQLNLFTKKSEQLAGNLVESFSDNQRTIRKMGYGAGQAGFYVLVGAFMPAVLVEIGFISNPKEEVYMNSKKGIQEVTYSIYKAIVNYKNELEKL